MKKICSIILLLSLTMSTLLLSGCGSKSSLTEDQQNMLIYGGILGSRNEDTFTELDGYYPDVESMLEEYWSVTDTATAKETLDWLVNEGHRIDGNEFLTVLKKGEENQYEDMDDVKKLYDDCNKMLTEIGVSEETLKKVNTIGAWDYDRLVNVARWSYSAGYITEEEAWSYIQKAREMAQTEFSSWDEYLASNVYGRSISYDGDPAELKETGDLLLNGDKSIWKDITFK